MTSEGAQRVRGEMSTTPASFPSRDAAREFWHRTRPNMSRAAIESRVKHTIHEVEGRWVWRLDMEGIAEARLSGDPARGIDLWRCVDSLRCPTLVVRGEHSDFLSTDACVEMAERQPLLRWRTISSAGHYVHDDNPSAYIEIVGRFCRDPA